MQRVRLCFLSLALLALVCACSEQDGAATVETPSATATASVMPSMTPAPARTAMPTPVPTATRAPPSVTPTPGSRITRPPGEIEIGNRERKEMSLTFDCGASGEPLPRILTALREAGVHTTFFITGQWATVYPELTRQVAREHEIANHSYSHPDFRELSDARILDEMRRGEETLGAIAGVTTKPLWRAPFGSRDQRIMQTVRNEGWLYHVYWTADSGDWRDITPAQVRANVTNAARNGAIIVQHCGSPQTAEVLPSIIDDLKALGFRLVSVSELLRD
jgi:peptidoglycan/xylan/chitin deacetylase (PgdA/CDA1 family)